MPPTVNPQDVVDLLVASVFLLILFVSAVSWYASRYAASKKAFEEARFALTVAQLLEERLADKPKRKNEWILGPDGEITEMESQETNRDAAQDSADVASAHSSGGI